MINTPAFESAERFQRLDKVYFEIRQFGAHHPYRWMMPYLEAAISRETEFMHANKERWETELKHE